MIAFLVGAQIVAVMALVSGGWVLGVHIDHPTPFTGILALLLIALGAGWTGIIFASLTHIIRDLGHSQKETAL